MKVIFRKDKTKKHVCYTCDKQFNWHNGARNYGKMEYKTIQERRRIEKVFCSVACANKFKQSKTNELWK
jgi:hypothetical protein